MVSFAFWNNKGGTGKTSLGFQAICKYAFTHPNRRILVVDLCPQANLSELLLGGLVGDGSIRLLELHRSDPRRSVGGYFQLRLPSPYALPAGIQATDFICTPASFNKQVPENLDLLPGDGIVELQANAIATLANTQIPGTNTWQAVIDWMRDFLELVTDRYQTVLLDTNPSFSVYTQIALAAAELLVLPVMADDSSRRAIENAFTLVHGANLPSPIYAPYSFSTKLEQSGRSAPLIHLVVKNRLTQYMGSASAFHTVLTAIDNLVRNQQQSTPQMFSPAAQTNGMVEVRDFGTTGVVAFAEGTPFDRLRAGIHNVMGKSVTVNKDYINDCNSAIKGIVDRLP
ncbi:MAG: AAA family ATPase [Isosphaeraceae bacterium]|nr:AAA family ATPase [Isosphaeraceae bacterium]